MKNSTLRIENVRLRWNFTSKIYQWGRLKCPSQRGVRLKEVIGNIDIQLKVLHPQLILVGYVLLEIKWFPTARNINVSCLEQIKDLTIVASKDIVILDHSTWNLHNDSNKLDQLVEKSTLKLKVSVLRGILQWKLIIGSEKSVRLMDVSVLQLSVLS